MNQRSKSNQLKSVSSFRRGPALKYSRSDAGAESLFGELPLKNELMELCREIAGALLRGFSDGKSGRAVREVIVNGLVEKLRCEVSQAQSLVDLSLELIHLQAYGKFRRNLLELSLLVARGGGEVGKLSSN